MEDERCVSFLQWALPKMGMRWEGFRKPRGQVCNRIEERMEELGLPGSSAYRDHLREHPGEWEELRRLCRVTISRFMRDREVWRWLFREYLPEEAGGMAEEETFRCWSAGCASGEEPYTVSLLWYRHVAGPHPALDLEVMGTDIDEEVLQRARRGCYPESSLKELEEDIVDEAFRRTGDEADPLCLRRAFRRPVSFRRQDLLEGMPEGDFPLILCRNLVFTYYQEGLQREVLEGLVARLPAGGLLVAGSSEEIPGGDHPLEEIGPGGCIRRSR
ncbi:MAG: CheR family methyltransferase [bacterium]